MNPGLPTLPPTGAPEPHTTVAAEALRVLVADDSRIDRRVVAAILQGRGHAVTPACDGREALELYDADPSSFDVAVIDLQMPGLDGSALAPALRAVARERAGRPLRLIALSSTPPKGDGWRALGLDDYLVKPIDPAVLAAAVEGGGPAPSPAAGNEGELGQRVVFDLGEALARARGKRQLVAELAQIFLEDAAIQMKLLRDAFAAADLERIERAAHRLKGSAMNVSAQLAADLAKEIERRARAGEQPPAEAWRQLGGQLEAEVGRARKALAGFLAQNGNGLEHDAPSGMAS